MDFSSFDSLTTMAGSSAAEEIAALTSATVVKAFNTTSAGPLTAGSAAGEPLDVFVAGEESARAEVAAFVAAAGMRPREAGGLHHARELEGFQLLVMAMQVNPALPDFNWGTALKIAGWSTPGDTRLQHHGEPGHEAGLPVVFHRPSQAHPFRTRPQALRAAAT